MKDEIKLPEELEKLTQHILRSSRFNPYSRQKLLDEFLNKPDPKEPKKYTQDWSAYNKAQQMEKITLIYILDELLQNIPFPEKKGVGQKGIPRRDQISPSRAMPAGDRTDRGSGGGCLTTLNTTKMSS